nr:dna cross-link repair protein snm1 [Quercus suber]
MRVILAPHVAMFRRPRNGDEDRIVGRPPTPPGAPAKTPFTLAIPPEVPPPVMTSRIRSPQTPLPTIGRQGPSGKSKSATPAKLKSKPNSSILNFFKKAEDESARDNGLFVDPNTPRSGLDIENRQPGIDEDFPYVDREKEGTRFNENENGNKRRKLSAALVGKARSLAVSCTRKTPGKRAGPFMEDSDSSDGDEEHAIISVNEETGVTLAAPQTESCATEDKVKFADNQILTNKEETKYVELPPLIKQETSYGGDLEDFEDFEATGEFDEDLFEDGDEFVERRYMEEQAKLEEFDSDISLVKRESSPKNVTPSCPICGFDLVGFLEPDVGVHVNNCLDGVPTALSKSQIPSPTQRPDAKFENAASASQYKRPVRAPRPGQANPFMFGQETTSGGSAFNKLMTGHAEDAAWAEAAAAEHASRGKPSYQRTCPFYKILPGLFICVDAFRYGAVAGCQAYFLSHFHSDHYVGLTSTWCHGPIYCSRITGNLVRQQLRVDPKYVIDLEFDQTVEVPGTKGVRVTMISANHCPGSSLFLFEKVVGKKTNGETRVQRILHCGDFRACKAHIEHPLLMPDIQDKVSGKAKEQKIDVCYLDTTYLNPKYAFPPQDQVIKACADMCVSLSKCTPDETDGWETMKRQRAGEGMVKFIRRESTNPETLDEDTKNDLKIENNPHASQQILSSNTSEKSRGRLLVIVGTYSIGKERICVGIAHALKSKIYAPAGKQRIVSALEDPELNALMTTNPREAQVHMTPLFEIRAETLDDYLKDFFPHFTRAVGFRPSGWNYRPPNSRFLDSPPVSTVLDGENWRSTYSMKELVPQRGSTSRSSCFGVPYSEHSSFRELTMFCCSLRIERVIPTVNVGSAKSRERMKAWADRWAVEKRKSGIWKGEW